MTTTAELLHFAILDITQFFHSNGVLIITTTNNPCHLTCYYTEVPPRRHRTSRILRGETMLAGAYWCFDAWKTVEQQEPGDTFTHTFNLVPWTACVTRWFTFRGTVEGILSPSAGPIFKKHMPYLFEKTFITRTSDGDIRTPTHIYDYILAHDGTSAHVVDTSNTWGVGQFTTADMYLILRAGLFFDTSSIPNSAIIYEATLNLRVKYGYGSGYHIVIVSGDDLSEPLQPHHYHDLLDNTISWGSAPKVGNERRLLIPLNALGLAHISKDALTKLALRTSYDIDYVPPDWWDHSYIYAAESDYKPYLTIKYYTEKPPSS